MLKNQWRKEVPGLEFNESGQQQYRFKGQRVPRVTEIIHHGVTFNTSHSRIQYGMERGKAVHLACQYHDEGVLDRKSLDENVAPYFFSYLEFLKVAKPEIIMIEQPVFNSSHIYAGCLDRAMIINGKTGVLDIKTGGDPEWSGLQTEAYRRALKSSFGIEATERWVLVLKKDRFQLNTKTGEGDFQSFLWKLQQYKMGATK